MPAPSMKESIKDRRALPVIPPLLASSLPSAEETQAHLAFRGDSSADGLPPGSIMSGLLGPPAREEDGKNTRQSTAHELLILISI